MKTKFIILFLLFVISSNNFFAQNVLQVKPPSAEVASLGKYIDQPVSLSSGIVDISVPIYNFKEGQLEIPISLSYYSGGIKVEETASKVGLGWNLNAGGVVSRTIKQLPDDSPTGYMYTNHTVNEFRIGIQNAQFTNEYVNSMSNRDYEPDTFSFSFLNYSGRFHYNKSSQSFMQIPFSNVKITPIFDTNKNITSWIFTDEKGIKYYFGNTNDSDNRTQVERQFNSISYNYNSEVGITGQNSNSDYISSWFLMKIESPKKDIVNFYYQESDFYDEIIKTESSIFKCYDNNSTDLNHRDENYLERRIKDTYLNKITSKSQEVIFENKKEERLDIPKTKALGSISIKNGTTLLKKYNLNYDYFISQDTKYNWVLGNRSSSIYRLKLNTIQEENALEQKLPAYKFFYNTTDLPNKTSYAQDAWGYYNGETNNTSLIPKILYYGLGFEVTVGSAIRALNESYAKAGILTKMEYPTGGSREFFYESNEVGLIVDKPDNNSFTEIQIRNEGFLPDPEDLSSDLGENPTAELKEFYSKEFTVKGRVSDFNINLNVEGVPDDYLYTTKAHFTFSIRGVTDPKYYIGLGSRHSKLQIPDGVYKIEARRQSYPRSTYGFVVTMAWNEKNTEKEKVGGLRIKRIITSDAKGNDLIKEFDYNRFSTKMSSGYCINYPFFIERNYFLDFSNSYKLSSQSQLPAVNLSKSVVAYENVTELDIDATNKANNGKIEYTYLANFVHDEPWNSAVGNGKMIDKRDKYVGWKVGNLLQVDTYAKKDTIFKIIESKINEHETFGPSIIPDFGVMSEVRNYGHNNTPGVAYLIYSSGSQWFRPTFSKSISYFNENTPLETIETYTYNNNPLLPSQVNKTNSKGEEIISKTFYPDDIISSTTLTPPLNSGELQIINKLKSNDQHQLTQTIQEESTIKKDGVISKIATNRIVFDDWGDNLIAPKMVMSAKGDGILERKIKYDLIDKTSGNLQQYTPEGGTSVCYIWGYNKTQPIAKIENISYANIPAGLITTAQDASNTGIETALIDALNALRIALPNAMVTTYTYIPLVGVSTITDPKGDTITYSYDNFGRLQFVKDKNKNILSENQYHYKQ
ncbi:RHS repeat protein [Flavobacterium sp. F-65]|uniref:RHS repeat protein n=1 Tax=Flavobacterium pisciphilum TaxID=2893755 RepID=A0ABS8MYR5_9FLAO|nr:RHS repeat domain-containing protein [Flavobacterium sp. F-65]MCC9073232.1 RHS repeat protein [Flavobacterium sp. F-65]